MLHAYVLFENDSRWHLDVIVTEDANRNLKLRDFYAIPMPRKGRHMPRISGSAVNPMILITIPMSHYCEKARWALNRHGIAYSEERHLQGFHYPRAIWAARSPYVPILIDGKKIFTDSTRILNYTDRFAEPGRELYPEPHAREVLAWEEDFDSGLGVESRRWAYFHYKDSPAKLLTVAGQGVPEWERLAFAAAYPILWNFVRRRLDVSADNVAAGIKICEAAFAKVSERLGPRGRFLVGKQFTAADLTYACMAAPLVLPAEYAVKLPDLEELPEAMRKAVVRFRRTRAGEFALRLFAEERPR